MKEETKIICIGCPKGCTISIEHEGKKILDVTGYRCKIGLEYATNEFTAPKRVFTSTVKLMNGDIKMLPVKTKGSVLKEKLFDIAKSICQLQVQAPVQIGDVICADICGTGVDLIAARDAAQR